jgi:hypothetical protein
MQGVGGAMKGAQDRKQKNKKQDLQVLSSYPGCLGRVINMFDLGNGVVATKMLTEKAHRDGMFVAPPSLVLHSVLRIFCVVLCYVAFCSNNL